MSHPLMCLVMATSCSKYVIPQSNGGGGALLNNIFKMRFINFCFAAIGSGIVIKVTYLSG